MNPSFRAYYRLDCPTAELPPGDYKILLAYHVGMVNNWKTIVRDQMHTLTECGLGKAASEFILSYSGGDLQELRDVLQPSGLFSPNASTITVESVTPPWEGIVMNTIQAHCAAKPMPSSIIVFYFHNKGSSKFQPNWRSTIHRNWTYSRSLYWRKMMEYFTLERPQLCLDQILNRGAGSCGIMFQRNHFSGNFWVASCDYLRTLMPLNMSASLSYVAAEFWIGSNRDANKKGRIPVSLHENPSPYGLYRHLILPSEYSDYGARWNEDLSYYQLHPDMQKKSQRS